MEHTTSAYHCSSRGIASGSILAFWNVDFFFKSLRFYRRGTPNWILVKAGTWFDTRWVLRIALAIFHARWVWIWRYTKYETYILRSDFWTSLVLMCAPWIPMLDSWSNYHKRLGSKIWLTILLKERVELHKSQVSHFSAEKSSQKVR